MIKILIVEDEEKIARFIELELIHEGYKVIKADNGRTGLEIAERGEADLIILDVMLPEINGLEVLRRIRKVSEVPIIMLTARDAVMDKVSGLDAGADDYITKPFAIEELLARIRTALKKRVFTVKKDEDVIRYIKKYEKIFIESVLSSIKSNTFKSMVTVSKNKNEHLEDYIVDDESKLDDESFREIFNEILDSTSIIEKIRIIKENINAKKDFIDILESECLFGEEYLMLFASLSELELAILGSVVFYEDIRMREINILEFMLNEKTETTLWKIEYIKFMKRQSEDKIYSIEEHMNKIN